MKLIDMVTFVLEQGKLLGTEDGGYISFANNILNYADFLKTPLSIGQFVPCDLEGTVLEPYIKTEDDIFKDENSICRAMSKEEVAYFKAKERCLFEGFRAERIDENIIDLYLNDSKFYWYWFENEFLTNYNFIPDIKTIEELMIQKHSVLTLTESAIKQLNL